MSSLNGAPELGIGLSDGEGDDADRIRVDLGRVNERVLQLAADQSRDVGRRLEREGRTELAQACFDFLPTRALLDLGGWDEPDIFAH